MSNNFYISPSEYQKLYQESINDPEKFWGVLAQKELVWQKKWDQVLSYNYPYYQWFKGAKLNITQNCLDRHLKNGQGNKIAYIYTNEDEEEEKITYQKLLENVNKLANGLKSLGVKKGDRIIIYMPLIIEQIISMLACARIGAIHSVVYGGFSAPALKMRIEDTQAKVIITATYTKRRGKKINLKSVVDEASQDLNFIEHILVFSRPGDQFKEDKKEIDFQKLIEGQSKECEAEEMDASDPLFILYTSGTTGQPKGIVHAHAGYNLYTHYTTKVVFNLHSEDLFWCTADPGWITGHSYLVYGPLSLGVTSLIYEGAPDYPEPDIWWKIIEKYQVNVLYTSPTAIRMFIKHGEEYPQKHDLSSLKILGSVGEPINPSVWQWYQKNIGGERCPVVDTWWQTETGGHMIVTLPSMTQKPGKAGLPFFGIEAEVVDNEGNILPVNTKGHLVIKKPWPAALNTCFNNPQRFLKYWQTIDHYFYTGDLAIKDKDGYFQILGREDDVINVSGHRIGSAEMENVLVSYPKVAEAAVIGIPDEIKGEAIKAFIVLKKGFTEDIAQEIKDYVKKQVGGFAVPEEVEVIDKLPKTRSGKIMRRVLKAKELNLDIGDISTLED